MSSMLLGMLFIVFMGLVISLVYWSAGLFDRAAAPPSHPQLTDRAQEELRMRYARGEIDREEYLQRKVDLEDL